MITGLFSRGAQEDLQRSSFYGVPSGLYVPAFTDAASWYLGYVTARSDTPLLATEIVGGLTNFGKDTSGIYGLSQANEANINLGFADGNAAAGLGSGTTPNALAAPSDDPSSSVTYNATLISSDGVLSDITVGAGQFSGLNSVTISLSDGVSSSSFAVPTQLYPTPFTIEGTPSIFLDINGSSNTAPSTAPALMIGGDGSSLTALGSQSVAVLVGVNGFVTAGSDASVFIGGNDNSITFANAPDIDGIDGGSIVLDGQDNNVSLAGLSNTVSSASANPVIGLGDASILPSVGNWTGTPETSSYDYFVTVSNTDYSYMQSEVTDEDSLVTVNTAFYGANGLEYESGVASSDEAQSGGSATAYDATGHAEGFENFYVTSSGSSPVLNYVDFTPASGSWTQDFMNFIPGTSSVSSISVNNADGSGINYDANTDGTWDEDYYNSAGATTEQIAYGIFYDSATDQNATGTQVTDASGNITFYAAGDPNAPTFTLPAGVPDDLTSAEAFWSNIISTTMNASGSSTSSTTTSAVGSTASMANIQSAGPGIAAVQVSHGTATHPHPANGMMLIAHSPLIHMA